MGRPTPLGSVHSGAGCARVNHRFELGTRRSSPSAYGHGPTHQRTKRGEGIAFGQWSYGPAGARVPWPIERNS